MSPKNDNVCIELGVASRIAPGCNTSGDHYVVQEISLGLRIAVIDGLGHGNEAAQAAQRAANTILVNSNSALIPLLERCHTELKSTRGVVINIAEINFRDDTMTWLAIGNVEGILLRYDRNATPSYERVLQRGGVIGYRLPPLHATILDLMRGDVIIMTTDGIVFNDGKGFNLNTSSQEIADYICNNYAKKNDDALILVVKYKGLHHE